MKLTVSHISLTAMLILLATSGVYGGPPAEEDDYEFTVQVTLADKKCNPGAAPAGGSPPTTSYVTGDETKTEPVMSECIYWCAVTARNQATDCPAYSFQSVTAPTPGACHGTHTNPCLQGTKRWALVKYPLLFQGELNFSCSWSSPSTCGLSWYIECTYDADSPELYWSDSVPDCVQGG